MTAGQLLTTLRYLHDKAGATVLRFWAYQTYTNGGTDWTGVDQVLGRRQDRRDEGNPRARGRPGRLHRPGDPHAESRVSE